MRVMVFGKATEDSKMDGPPTPEQLEAFAAMDRFTEELVKAGVFVAAAGLKNGAQAKRIVFDGPGRTVIDGPFTEAKELIGGYAIIKAASKAEAVKLGSEFMELHRKVLADKWDGEVEIRQLEEYDPGA